MRVSDKYVYFWRGFIGNWFKSPIIEVIDEYPYHFLNVEQYFMYMKARTFGDEEQCKNILGCKTPKEAKNYGRLVKNYNDKVWDEKRYEIMKRGIYLKFTQNKKLKEMLLSKEYDEREFVEASPYDRIWGVGLSEDNPLIDDKLNWKGRNLMGKAVTEVREQILQDEFKN